MEIAVLANKSLIMPSAALVQVSQLGGRGERFVMQMKMDMDTLMRRNSTSLSSML
ncbi:hypothetical protein Pint_08796 [Pistacia integerrima]|uniref:Uncharacterized protein n=1 Tax=Pistacia integerrima TaxID=434235 RepID=A0ACC0XTL0_9ROSI|nr:hypothetical protein Pint_08796 [Pistacia integerrima]